MMNVTVYGDFNCPYSYLASQRADLLNLAGAAAVDWRAVEHDRGLPLTGTRPDSDRSPWDRSLVEAASLALPAEHVPTGPPALISNTQAAVTAYAEAVSDGVAGELRHRLFRAIWVHGLHLSSAYEVRRLITRVMWPQEDITDRLASPEIPSLLLQGPDPARIVRRSGGTIAPDGGPLTTAGWLRIRRWRQEWLALPCQAIPAVIGPDQEVRPGAAGLRYLADLADAVGAAPRSPAVPGNDGAPAAALPGQQARTSAYDGLGSVLGGHLHGRPRTRPGPGLGRGRAWCASAALAVTSLPGKTCPTGTGRLISTKIPDIK